MDIFNIENCWVLCFNLNFYLWCTAKTHKNYLITNCTLWQKLRKNKWKTCCTFHILLRKSLRNIQIRISLIHIFVKFSQFFICFCSYRLLVYLSYRVWQVSTVYLDPQTEHNRRRGKSDNSERAQSQTWGQIRKSWTESQQVRLKTNKWFRTSVVEWTALKFYKSQLILLSFSSFR